MQVLCGVRGGTPTPGKTAGEGGSDPSSELPLTYPRAALQSAPKAFILL